MEVKAEYYREQANRCRDLARRITDAEAKTTLLKVALEYDGLAREAEEPVSRDE